ncbi:class I SAM-dependent methyltransferase [Streptomyces sp. HNM0663]|uniref:Class I SAM-dependent methyltransferase n=1 Tax=Streptomyces chengmaiensis TaxID=3040919 RepID=A0ABT6HMR4_9ACTN|nr:class I SAM-dependent methyltransferase [Streptomyces chengmaiensis]MDH2390014.1 class I SAM-dependent methyltransferase [Streptomyces chengmaiensis]
MGGLTREGHQGTGPGAITPDGCAVELYRRLPAGAEPDIIEAAAPAGASLLELGSGTGRMTHPLVERGFAVTAVDESAEMLEHVRGARRTVRSPIESLELGEKFDVVVLASHLVHTGDDRVREGLLRTCRRHVKDDGCVLIQREPRDAHTGLPKERVDPAGYTVRFVSSEPLGDGTHSLHIEYAFPDARWTQTFRSRPLSTEDFEAHLWAAGLAVDAYLTDEGTCVRARPSVPGAVASGGNGG